MGNLFAYFVATSVVDPITNRWQLRRRRKKYQRPQASTSYNFFHNLRGDTDSTVSSSRGSSNSSEDQNEDESYTSPPSGTKLERVSDFHWYFYQHRPTF